MRSRSLFASILMVCWLAAGFLGGAAVGDAALAGQSLLNPGKSSRTNAIEVKHRGRGPQTYLPIAPSYLYYDYPYYYSRGYYPNHIAPGFIYYGYPYSTYTRRYLRYGDRCSHWRGTCVASWRHNRSPASSERHPRQSLGVCRCL